MSNAWGDEEAPATAAATNDWGDEPAEPRKKKPSVMEAAFPGANRSYSPQTVPMPFYGGMTGRELTRTMGENEQQGVAAIGDVLSLPTRAAGATGAALGYQGAGGAGPYASFRENLGNEDTGLMRPARHASADFMREGLEGGEDGQRGLMDWGKVIAGGAGYLGSSVVEDPVTWLSAVKPAVSAVRSAAKGTAGKVAKGAENASERLIRRDYMPLKSHEKAGWNAKAAVKHGLYGKDAEGLAKAGNEKLATLYKKQKSLIQAGKAAGGRVDFQQALDDAMAKIEKGTDSELWDRAPALAEEYKRRISRIRDLAKADPAEVSKAMSKDVADAQLFKSDLGEDAAFASMKGVPGIDKDAAVRGRFAAILYGNVKDQIEKNVPPGLRDINKAMSEIIPLRNAADYRAAVEGRQRVGKLTDFVLGGGAMVEPTVGLPALALKKLVDSPRFTKAAVQLKGFAEKMAKAKSKSEATFYAKKLQALGVTAAEIDALSAGSEFLQGASTIPFKRAADAKENKPQPVAVSE